MHRLLIVAYYFPPLGGIGSIRLARFAEMLPDFGWEPTVLAPSATPHAPDPTLRFPEDRVVRARSLELSRASRIVTGGGAEVGSTTTRQTLRSSLRTTGLRLVFPDAQVGWYPAAVVAGRRALRRGQFDAIFSSSYPMTAHLIGRTLSRSSHLPWVAEYRDPWSTLLGADSPHRKRAQSLEQAVADAAAAVVMTSPRWARHFGAIWGRDVDVIRNGFDASERLTLTAPDRPTLTYLGTYYPGRQNLVPLWQALARWRTRTGSDPPRVRIIGRVPSDGQAEIAAAGIRDLVKETGIVSHEEAMRLLGASTVLVASGETRGDVIARGTIPAKVFEYLATPLPVVYLGDPTDDAAELLRSRPGGFVVPHADADGLDAALDRLTTGATYDRDVTDLSRRATTSELAKLLDRVAS